MQPIKTMKEIAGKILLPVLLPPPGPGWMYTMINAYDSRVNPWSPELINLTIEAARLARDIDLSSVSDRIESGQRFPDVWPGEHYKLLAAIISIVKPKSIIEIGTFTGLSALTMLKFLPADSTLTTFDIVSWDRPQGPAGHKTCLKKSDFADGRLRQVLGDLADPAVMAQHAPLLTSADMFFIDAPKDGVFEPKLFAGLRKLDFPKKPLLILDDIYFFTMLDLWHSIRSPKFDASCFGHWSGTGLVKWDSRSESRA